MKKFCKGCEIEKDISDFYIKKDGKVGSSYCKSCYYIKYNKGNRSEYYKKYREENTDLLKEKQKEFRENNKELVTKRKKEYYQNLSPEKKEELKLKNKENYHKNNHKENKRQYVKEKLETDDFFKLKFNIRSLIRNSLKRGFTEKSKKTIEILGCSFEDFKLHLESQFDENMNWENQGSYWHMDHIIPISSAETDQDVYRLNHYTNFQPLYWLDNLKKGNNLPSTQF